MYDTMASKSVSTSTSMVPSDPMPHPPSTSAPIKSPDPQPPNLSAFLTETEQTSERQTGTHNGTEPAAVGDILMEYSSDLLCSPSSGIVTKNYLKELRSE